MNFGFSSLSENPTIFIFCAVSVKRSLNFMSYFVSFFSLVYFVMINRRLNDLWWDTVLNIAGSEVNKDSITRKAARGVISFIIGSLANDYYFSKVLVYSLQVWKRDFQMDLRYRPVFIPIWISYWILFITTETTTCCVYCNWPM